jgi:hypothetical protein
MFCHLSFVIYHFPMLFFQARFLDLIRRGCKTQTIRLWQYPRVKVGQRAYVPGLSPARLLITAVDPLPSLAALTAADARADGFTTCRQLRAEIARLYKGVTGRQLYRVRFQYLPTAPKMSKPAPHRQSSPSSAAARARRRQLARFLRALDPAKAR